MYAVDAKSSPIGEISLFDEIEIEGGGEKIIPE